MSIPYWHRVCAALAAGRDGRALATGGASAARRSPADQQARLRGLRGLWRTARFGPAARRAQQPHGDGAAGDPGTTGVGLDGGGRWTVYPSGRRVTSWIF